MKKTVILSVAALTLLASCGTNAGSGAYIGAQFGSILGSAIGGISGGPRGNDIGTLIGMAGGAVVGGAVGAQADKAREQQYDSRSSAARSSRLGVNQRYSSSAENDEQYSSAGSYARQGDVDSGFDPQGRGDDTLYDFNASDYTGNYSATAPQTVVPEVRYDQLENTPKTNAPAIEIRNARFVDDNQDSQLNAGEICKVIFELYNTSSAAVVDLQPTVVETTGNKRIMISSTVHLERLMPGKGIRYTAMVKASDRLKDGTASFRVCALQGNGQLCSNVCVFNVPTVGR